MITCPSCASPIDPVTIEADGTARCPACTKDWETTLFPALLAPDMRGIAVEHLNGADDAACYYHHGNTAVAACGECGAFVCALCDIVVGAAHWCPRCFNLRYAAGAAGRDIMLHDYAALALATVGMIVVPCTLFLGMLYGPLIIAYAFWNWNNVHTPYRRSRWRFGVAIALALCEMGASVTFIAAIALSD